MGDPPHDQKISDLQQQLKKAKEKLKQVSSNEFEKKSEEVVELSDKNILKLEQEQTKAFSSKLATNKQKEKVAAQSVTNELSRDLDRGDRGGKRKSRRNKKRKRKRISRKNRRKSYSHRRR